MGCAASKHARDQVEDPEEDLRAPTGATNKADTARARRLSISVKPQQGQAHAMAVITRVGSSSRKSEDGKQTQHPTTLNPTRSRRLSHVYAAQDVLQQLASAAAAQEDGSNLSPRSPRNPTAIGPAGRQSPRQSPRTSLQIKRGVRVQVACLSRAGREPGFKKTNQDNCFAFEKYMSDNQALFGAMDGHGPNGHMVSGFVKKQLPVLLVNHLTSGAGVRNALSSVFLEVDDELAGSSIDCEFSGCTCAVAHIEGRTLTTAWVGDSRMVLGRQKKGSWRNAWEAIDISVDHKPTQAEERQRIMDSRGRVERLVDEFGQPMGPYRVWLEHAWLPGLAMSRALGDQLAHTVGVTSEPQHVQIELTPADKLLVLASDGVWEFISSKEAIALIGDCETPEDACRVLVDEAYQRWLDEEEGVVDDITAVVVKLLYDQ